MTDDLTREHERALLACALLGGTHTALNLLGMVQAPMLADARLARAWSALRRVLAGATGPVDLIDALAAELRGDADAPSLTDLHPLGHGRALCWPTPPTPRSASIDHVRRQAAAQNTATLENRRRCRLFYCRGRELCAFTPGLDLFPWYHVIMIPWKCKRPT